MQETVYLRTTKREELYDITQKVSGFVGITGINEGLVNIYAQGSTAAIMIQENWDETVRNDVVRFLRDLVPRGVWEHDKHDGNADSHLKSGLVDQSKTVPIVNGKLGLSTWQNIYFCEFDGPRNQREVVLTAISSQA